MENMCSTCTLGQSEPSWPELISVQCSMTDHKLVVILSLDGMLARRLVHAVGSVGTNPQNFVRRP